MNRRVAPGHPKKFAFVDKEPEPAFEEEPRLQEFLRDASRSGNPTEEEIGFLRKLRFKGKRPAPLYYYRELQNLRDPFIFAPRSRIGVRRNSEVAGPVPGITTRKQRRRAIADPLEVSPSANLMDRNPFNLTRLPVADYHCRSYTETRWLRIR